MTDDPGAALSGTGSREPSPAVSAASGFNPSRWLTVAEAEGQGYSVEHAIDGRVRSMTTREGYLVVYGAPSYMNAAWRAFKRGRDARASPTMPDTADKGDLTRAEVEAFEAAFRDSDGSPKGGDGSPGSVHDGAGRNGIANPPSKDTPS